MLRKESKYILPISIFTGAWGIVWLSTFQPDVLFGVFFRNNLGASSTQLGILSAILQFSAITNLLSIFIFRKLIYRKFAFILFMLVQRGLGLVPAIIAFMNDSIPLSVSVKLIYISLGLSWACMNIATVGWTSWIADMIPESSRVTFFVRRSAVINIINMIWLFIIPAIIDIFPNPLVTYGVVFCVSTVLGTVSLLFLIIIPKVPAVLSPEEKVWKIFI